MTMFRFGVVCLITDHAHRTLESFIKVTYSIWTNGGFSQLLEVCRTKCTCTSMTMRIFTLNLRAYAYCITWECKLYADCWLTHWFWFRKRGGKGRGGRGKARQTIQPRDIVLSDVSLEYVSDTASGATGSRTLLENATLKFLHGKVYSIVGRYVPL